MATVGGLTEQEIIAREKVFEGLIAKATRMSLRSLTANLPELITAAVSPEPAPNSPTLTWGDVSVVTVTWNTYVDGELTDFLEDTYAASAAKVAGGRIDPVVRANAKTWLAGVVDRLKHIGTTIWNTLTSQLTEGYAAGDSTAQLAARVRATTELTAGRANSNARTEVLAAANAGSLAQMRTAFTDAEASKTWLATEDERTRLAHHLADGQTVSLSQPFSVGGENLDYPGDPNGSPGNVYNCRCTLVYKFSDDDDELLTASDWTLEDEKKHKRDAHGRFAHNASFMSPDEAAGMWKEMTSAKPLTADEQRGLRRYAGFGYTPMNSLLRYNVDLFPNDPAESQAIKKNIANARSAMRPLPRPVKVRRGVQIDAFGQKHAIGLLAGIQAFKGKTIRDRGFLSTSVHEDWGRSDGSYPIVIELDVPAGVGAAYMADESSFKQEAELLLEPDLDIEVTDVTKSNGVVQVNARVVGRSGRPLTASTWTPTDEAKHKRDTHGRFTKKGGSKLNDAFFKPISHKDAVAMQEEMLADHPWQSFEQIDAVNSYGGGGYYDINGLLREDPHTVGMMDSATRAAVERQIKNIDNSLHPLPRDVKVKRGVTLRAFGVDPKSPLRNDYLNDLVGKVVQDKAFLSTSIDMDWMEDTGYRGALMEINVPAGVRGGYLPGMSGVSAIDEERELLLERGLALHITHIDTSSDPTRVYATVLRKGKPLTAAKGLTSGKVAKPHPSDWVESLHPRSKSSGKFVKKGAEGVGIVQTAGKKLTPTAAIYKTSYVDGATVAELPGAIPQRITWNEKTKKFDFHAYNTGTGGWFVSKSLGKGDTYAVVKDGTWYEPGTLNDVKPVAATNAPAVHVPDFTVMLPDEIGDWIDDLTPEKWKSLPPADKSIIAKEAADNGFTNELNEAVSAKLPSTPTKPSGWPTADKLKFTGKTAGSHGSKFYVDTTTGKQYLFKNYGHAGFLAELDVATADIAHKLGVPTANIEKITLDGQPGTLHEIIPNTAELGDTPITKLTSGQIAQLQRQQVLNWLISNSDAHGENFLTEQGSEKIYGIDLGQAFKYFGKDKLDWNYQPNAIGNHTYVPVPNIMMRAYIKGDIDMPLSSISGIIQSIDALSDDEYENILKPFAKKAAAEGKLAYGNVDSFLYAAVQRKKNLKADFVELYSNLAIARAKAGNAPQPAVVTPPKVATPSVKKTATPIKINTATVYKTKYNHQQVVAVREGVPGKHPAERLVWWETNKKFILQRQDENGAWKSFAGYTKGDTYTKFKNDLNWKIPDVPVDTTGGTSAGSPQNAPSISGVSTPSAAKTGVPAIESQFGDINSFSEALKKNIFEAVKGQGVTLSKPPETIFAAVVSVAKKYQDDKIAITLLQVLNAVDAYGAQKAGKPNTGVYKDKIIAWLKTPVGKKKSNDILNPPPPPPPFALTPPSKISKPDVNVTSEDFKPTTATSMQKIQDTMLAKHDFWTQAQKDALRGYTGSDYMLINTSLRGDTKMSPTLQYQVKNMQAAMKPLGKNVLLFRQTHTLFTGQKDFSLSGMKKLVGTVIQDKGFTSVSTDKKYASGEAKFSLEVEVPRGTPAAFVKSLSHYKSENETVLAAGTKFEIISVTQHPNEYVGHLLVRLRVVP